jgi:V/A-type H+-transporting ATPase subunit A
MSRASIRWLAGPVLRAVAEGPFAMRESVRVGPQALLGEVVRIDGDEIVVQVYEDTTGLRPGSLVEGSGLPLAIPLGPGLLGNIFDGLLRPLSGTGSAFVQPGMRRTEAALFAFSPQAKAGDVLPPGAIIGHARGRTGRADERPPSSLRSLPPEGVHSALRAAGRAQAVLAPPDAEGEVVAVAAEGEYRETAAVCTLRAADGTTRLLSMRHDWPVRVPRPVARRLTPLAPLVTGQRIIDCLFPVAQGGKAAVPGGFGTGKTVLLEALAKGCNADVIVYLGCGERGNEMAGVLEEFPQLTDPRNDRPLMERTVIIANTSNMPVAAREASIYSAITVAEYFRDQGLSVALMADSTSRWAEALREVSGRFGELPGEGGYPAYLSSRIADFYERAAIVEPLCGGVGSVTVIGAISPPSGDFSEPVTSHTKRYVKAFWALDVKRAQARFYPAIHPLQSYAEDAQTFAPWWTEQGFSQWLPLRRRFLTLLDNEAHLERMARIIGKDALPARQQLTLLCADLVNESFLRQNAFSPIDRVCSPARQGAMMRVIGRFIDLAETAAAAGVRPDRLARMTCLRPLQRMGEEIGDDELPRFAEIEAAMEREFAQLTHESETSDAAHG